MRYPVARVVLLPVSGKTTQAQDRFAAAAVCLPELHIVKCARGAWRMPFFAQKEILIRNLGGLLPQCHDIVARLGFFRSDRSGAARSTGHSVARLYPCPECPGSAGKDAGSRWVQKYRTFDVCAPGYVPGCVYAAWRCAVAHAATECNPSLP